MAVVAAGYFETVLAVLGVDLAAGLAEVVVAVGLLGGGAVLEV